MRNVCRRELESYFKRVNASISGIMQQFKTSPLGGFCRKIDVTQVERHFVSVRRSQFSGQSVK